MLSIRIVSYNKSKHLINAVQSILNSRVNFGFEILVFEGGQNKENQQLFVDYINSNAINCVRYFKNRGNFGLSKALNFLNQESSVYTSYIVELNEDMFFHPDCLQNLVNALLQSPELGLACSLMENGTRYAKMDPQPQDLIDFADAHKVLPDFKLGLGASNLPWCMTQDFYDKLAGIDVWSDLVPLPFNKYYGIWDESIDQYAGWTADWDLHNRVQASGKKCAIVENALVYHYDHCSGSELDSNKPGWTCPAVANYVQKWGDFRKDIVAPGAAIQKLVFPKGIYPQW